MARDVLDIWNQSLAYVGARAAVQAVDESTREAQHLNSVYTLIRDAELEGGITSFDWNFLTAYRSLAPLSEDKPESWEYAYAYPSNCIKFRFIEGASRWEDDPLPFEIAASVDTDARIIYCDTEDAVGCYSKLVTDPSLWSAKFCDALAWKLAGSLAMTEIGSVSDKDKMEKQYTIEIGRAMTQSANEEQRDAQRDSAGIRSRH